MAFGQQPGRRRRPASWPSSWCCCGRSGYADFREARGPMGFTQRQAGGRFTRQEAATVIEQLQDAGPAGWQARLSDVPSEELAFELQRRGWVVREP